MSEGRRGAVRSEAARSAILAATSSLIARFGYDRVTVEGIASDAGVGKQTIYRWWPSKSAVVAECLLEGVLLPETFAPLDTGDIAADLTEWIQRVFDFVDIPAHETLIRSLIGAAVENAEVGARLYERLGASPDVLTERLRVALSEGQLRSGLSVDMICDTFIGFILTRVLLRPAQPAEGTYPRGPASTADEARALVKFLLHGAAATADLGSPQSLGTPASSKI